MQTRMRAVLITVVTLSWIWPLTAQSKYGESGTKEYSLSLLFDDSKITTRVLDQDIDLESSSRQFGLSFAYFPLDNLRLEIAAKFNSDESKAGDNAPETETAFGLGLSATYFLFEWEKAFIGPVVMVQFDAIEDKGGRIEVDGTGGSMAVGVSIHSAMGTRLTTHFTFAYQTGVIEGDATVQQSNSQTNVSGDFDIDSSGFVAIYGFGIYW
jgi:hypothetical protein